MRWRSTPALQTARSRSDACALWCYCRQRRCNCRWQRGRRRCDRLSLRRTGGGGHGGDHGCHGAGLRRRRRAREAGERGCCQRRQRRNDRHRRRRPGRRGGLRGRSKCHDSRHCRRRSIGNRRGSRPAGTRHAKRPLADGIDHQVQAPRGRKGLNTLTTVTTLLQSRRIEHVGAICLIGIHVQVARAAQSAAVVGPVQIPRSRSNKCRCSLIDRTAWLSRALGLQQLQPCGDPDGPDRGGMAVAASVVAGSSRGPGVPCDDGASGTAMSEPVPLGLALVPTQALAASKLPRRTINPAARTRTSIPMIQHPYVPPGS